MQSEGPINWDLSVGGQLSSVSNRARKSRKTAFVTPIRGLKLADVIGNVFCSPVIANDSQTYNTCTLERIYKIDLSEEPGILQNLPWDVVVNNQSGKRLVTDTLLNVCTNGVFGRSFDRKFISES